MLAFDYLLGLQHDNPILYQQIHGATFTARDILQEVWRKTHALKNRNVSSGDNIVIFADDSVDFICTFWALTAIGVKIIPLLKDEKQSQLRTVLQRHCIDGIITDEKIEVENIPVYSLDELTSSINSEIIWHRYGQDESWLCLPTSGTSGGFKLIVHTNLSMLDMVDTSLQASNNHGGFNGVLFSPAKIPFGVGILYNVIGPLIMNYIALIGFRPSYMKSVVDILVKYQVNHLVVMPHFIEFMSRFANDKLPPSLQSVTSAGDFLLDAIAENFKKQFGTDINNIYGMSEYGCIASGLHVSSNIAGQSLFDFADIRVVDDSNIDCGLNQSGIIQIRPRHCFSGYLDDTESTHLVLRNGWIHTNDVGQICDNGILMLFGRRNSYFKLRSKWFSTIDLENKIVKIKNVVDCVASHRDGNLLLKLKLTDDAEQTQTETKKFILNKFEKIFHNLSIEFVNEIPRTLNMKKVRQQYE